MIFQQRPSARSICILAATATLFMTAACSNEGQLEAAVGEGEEWSTTKATMIVAASPGGGSDLMARTVAQGIEEIDENITITVENHPGGSTAVGYSHLLSKTGNPEFLVGAETTLSALPLAIDTAYRWDDFTPIAQIAEDALIVAVPANSDYESLDDLAEAVREGEKLRAGIVAAVGPDSVLLDLLSKDQGVEYEPVVFEAADESNAALLAGNIDFLINNPGESKAYVESEDMRFLATFTEERLEDEMFTDLPTAIEQGVDVEFAQWRGVLAAGDIPEESAAYWQEQISAWTEQESYTEYIKKNDLVPILRTGREFEDYLTEYEGVLSESISKD